MAAHFGRNTRPQGKDRMRGEDSTVGRLCDVAASNIGKRGWPAGIKAGLRPQRRDPPAPQITGLMVEKTAQPVHCHLA